LELHNHQRDIVAGNPSAKKGPSDAEKTEPKNAETKPSFVDRQFQKAVEYLTSELAKAS
jgi:hypothetical protein